MFVGPALHRQKSCITETQKVYLSCHVALSDWLRVYKRLIRSCLVAKRCPLRHQPTPVRMGSFSSLRCQLSSPGGRWNGAFFKVRVLDRRAAEVGGVSSEPLPAGGASSRCGHLHAQLYRVPSDLPGLNGCGLDRHAPQPFLYARYFCVEKISFHWQNPSVGADVSSLLKEKFCTFPTTKVLMRSFSTSRLKLKV